MVRRPPPPPVPPGAHDVLREAALLRGLAESDVPVPAVLATAEPGEILEDVPLVVLEFVAGPVVTTATPEVLFSGGRVLHDPTLVSVTFPGDSLADELEDFIASLGCSDYWRIVTSDYGIGDAVAVTPADMIPAPDDPGEGGIPSDARVHRVRHS